MAHMSKAAARKRLNEAVEKLSKVQRAGHITPAMWVKWTEPMLKRIKALK
jgi:hypothetical protein